MSQSEQENKSQLKYFGLNNNYDYVDDTKSK